MNLDSFDDSLSPEDQIDQACDRFEKDWKSGSKPSLEQFVASFPGVLRGRALQELLALELTLQFQLGDDELVPVDEYVKRFPQYKGVVEACYAEELQKLQGTHVADAISDNAGITSTPLVPNAGNHPPGHHGSGSSPSAAGGGSVRPGGQIDRYQLIEELGEGSQGTTYRAYDPALRCDTVIKICQPEKKSRQAGDESLAAEGRLLAGLQHENLVRVLNLGRHEGRTFLVMDFHQNQQTLDQYAKEHRYSETEAIELTYKIATALDYVHRANVLHLDIKPQNILIDTVTGIPRLIDFGLARTKTVYNEFGPDQASLTGTPSYMAPEKARCEADSVGRRADIFSLGGVLYFLLTGKSPIRATTLSECLAKARIADWDRDLLHQSAGAEVRAVVERAMTADPEARYRDAAEMADALKQLLPPPSSPRPPWEKILVVVSLLLALGGFWGWSQYFVSPAPPLQNPLRIRVWRAEKPFDLVDSAPVETDDGVEIKSDIPAGLHVGLFLFDTEGKLQLVDSRPPAEAPYEYRFPRDDKFKRIIGPAGTEFVFLCARRDRAFDEEELSGLTQFQSAWPKLVDDTVIALRNDKVEFENQPRGFGGSFEVVDSNELVHQAMESLRVELAQRVEFVSGLAFSHTE